MKKTILASAVLLLSMTLFAQLDEKNEFDDPANVIDSYINEINGKIEVDLEAAMKDACDGDSCTLFVNEQKISGWDFEVNLGEDSRDYRTTATRQDGSVVVINTPSDPNNTLEADDNKFYGITLKYKNYTCKQKIRTTRQSYVTLNTFQDQMVSEDGTIRRKLYPSQRVMLMYLTSIIDKLDGSSCSVR